MKNFLDLNLAFFALILSGIISFYAFSAIERKKADSVVLEGIPAEYQEFIVMSGTGGCAGKLQFVVVDEVARGFLLYGRVMAADDGDPFEVEIHAEFLFNFLGQLSRSSSRLVSDTFSIRVNTEGIRPLRLALSYQDGDIARSLEGMTVPGPINLNPGNDGYRLESDLLRKLKRGYTDSFRKNIVSNFKASLVKDTRECEQPDPLDISALKNGVQDFFETLADTYGSLPDKRG